MSAPMSPASSATPTPIIATKMTPTTPKPAKLATNDVKMKRMPSAVSRLSTAVVSVSMSHVLGVGVLDRDIRDLDGAAGRVVLPRPRRAAARRPRR